MVRLAAIRLHWGQKSDISIERSKIKMITSWNADPLSINDECPTEHLIYICKHWPAIFVILRWGLYPKMHKPHQYITGSNINVQETKSFIQQLHCIIELKGSIWFNKNSAVSDLWANIIININNNINHSQPNSQRAAVTLPIVCDDPGDSVQ
jgi:hypothetical protein